MHGIKLKNYWPVLKFRKPHLRTSDDEIGWLLSNMLPKYAGYEYIRLGPKGDGGYVLPNDLIDIKACFSPGVNNQIGFEIDLLERFGVASHLCDEQNKKPELPESFSYDNFWLAEKTMLGFSTFTDWVQSYNSGQNDDLILQMDIEGAEWQVLALTPDDLLSRFRIIIVELHTLGKIASWRRFHNEVKPLFVKLFRYHYVAYLHANNCLGASAFGPVIIPEVVEVTFHRLDRLKAEPETLRIPTALDYDCVPERPAVSFYDSWLDYLGISAFWEISR